MNELSWAIEEAKNNCIETGSGNIKMDNIEIEATWEEWENDAEFDIVTIYIYENYVIKFRYQLEETKVKAE